MWRGGTLPGKWILIPLTVLGSERNGTSSYGPRFGRDASVALLAIMLGLKVLELKALRDATVVICLGFFLIITNFLYSQTIPDRAVHAGHHGMAHGDASRFSRLQPHAAATASAALSRYADAAGRPADARSVPAVSARAGAVVRLPASHVGWRYGPVRQHVTGQSQQSELVG